MDEDQRSGSELRSLCGFEGICPSFPICEIREICGSFLPLRSGASIVSKCPAADVVLIDSARNDDSRQTPHLSPLTLRSPFPPRPSLRYRPGMSTDQTTPPAGAPRLQITGSRQFNAWLAE